MAFVLSVLAGLSAPRATGQANPSNQTNPQRPPVFRGGANFVYVDVYPRRDGRLIEGLRAGDFQILEDGKPQTIETFELVRFAPNTPDAERRDPNSAQEAERLAADPRNRVFIIYLDLYHTSIPGSHEARRPIVDFLTRAIGPSDLFAAMTPEVPLGQLTFARRSDTLEAELAKYWAWGIERESETGRVFLRTPAERALAQKCLRDPDLIDRLVLLHREDLLLGSLEGLLTHLRDVRDERKNLLFVSEGWVPGGPQTGLLGRVSGRLPVIGVDPGGRLGIGKRQAGSTDDAACDSEIGRLASIDFQQRFRDLLSLANRANVSFYPVDVGGLKPPPGFSADQRGTPTPEQLFAMGTAASEKLATLRTLAENTDGFAVVETNDLTAGVRRIADDLSAYYLLGYYSTNQSFDGKFRRIEVKVNQPGIRLAARRGYLAPSLDAERANVANANRPAPAPAGLVAALGRLARLRPDTAIHTYAVASFGMLDVITEIGRQDVAAAIGSAGADVEVTVGREGQTNRLAKGQIEPGARAARVRVPLESTDQGPWRIALKVMAGGEALQDRLEVTPSTATLVGDPILFRATPAPRSPLRPVGNFEFSRTERIHMEWPVLKALDRREARVLDRNGRPLAVAVTVAEAEISGRATLIADANLAPLAAGDYVFELVVGSGADTETKFVAIRVVR